MKQLKNTKKIEGTFSPEKTLKAGGQTTTAGAGFADDTPINLLLFSNLKKTAIGNLAQQTSLGNTMNSNNSNYYNVILPLKNIIKTS